MSSVSPRQHRAMEAAKSGNSTLGIPQSVGAEFSAADEAEPKGTFSKTMQHHGVARSSDHKRHPSTSHYSMGREGNRFRKRT